MLFVPFSFVLFDIFKGLFHGFVHRLLAFPLFTFSLAERPWTIIINSCQLDR